MPKKNLKTVIHLWPEMKDYMGKKLHGFPAVLIGKKMTLETADPATEILSVFVESPVTKEVFDALPNLKCIATMSTGFDHIDLREAKKRGVTVCTVPTYGENTVAEHTFALILGLTRRLFDSVKSVKEGRYGFGGLRGVDLKGKTLGIVGTGHIGLHVARIAKGFEMNVLAYDIHKNVQEAKRLGFTYAPLASVLKKSDIVTLHTPLFKETYHLINRTNINQMKQDSFLINTARGALIEPQAILDGLNSGRLAGAGLDVMEDENLIQNFEEVMRCSDSDCKLKTTVINNLIIDHPKAIVTPHNAFNSTEAIKRIIDVTADNIIAFAKGKPQNTLTLQ